MSKCLPSSSPVLLTLNLLIMELHQIKTYLDSTNPQHRMKAITELRHYAPEVVVPLLKRRINDKEFVIRSFVAMGLGNKQTEEAFEALVDLIEFDTDPNVRAEAANSLAKYGDRAMPHLSKLFERDTHWLVRQSLLAALSETEYSEILLKFCRLAIEGLDLVVKQAGIASMGQLEGTPQAEEALEILLSLATSRTVEIRIQVALILTYFDSPRAREALMKLRSDSDYRVVAATLEALV